MIMVSEHDQVVGHAPSVAEDLATDPGRAYAAGPHDRADLRAFRCGDRPPGGFAVIRLRSRSQSVTLDCTGPEGVLSPERPPPFFGWLRHEPC